MDTGSLLSERALELVLRARGVAASDKSEELDARHLLAAALQVDTTRRMLDEAGVDVERLSQRLGVGATLTADAAQAGPVEPSPSAKRALLDAYQPSRQLGTPASAPSTSFRPWPRLRSRRPGVPWPNRPAPGRWIR
ncbi:Clp protease N-terminal domain-containing protein [Streptomyces sp. MN13]